MKITRVFVLLFTIMLAVPLTTSGGQDGGAQIPRAVLEAAIQAANSDIPALGRPDAWRFEILQRAGDSALGCPIAAGYALPAPVTPYRLHLIYGANTYIVHVSADASLVQLCDPKFPGMGTGPGPTPTIDPYATPTLAPTVCVLTTLGAFANVRNGPSTDSTQVDTVYENAAHPVLGRAVDNTWYLIDRGWVSATVSTVYGPCFDVPVIDASVTSGTTLDYPCPADFAGYLPPRIHVTDLTAIVASGGVPNRLRTMPSVNAPQIGEIPPGTGANRILAGPACNEGYVWWRVEYRDLVGWTAESSAATGEYFLNPSGSTAAAQPTVTSGTAAAVQPTVALQPEIGGQPGEPLAPITPANVSALTLNRALPGADFSDLVFAPDGSRVVGFRSSGTDGGAVEIYDFPSGEYDEALSRQIFTGPAPVDALAISGDSALLAVGRADGSIAILDFGSGDVTSIPGAHSTAVGALAFSPAAPRLLSIGVDSDGQDATMKLWNLNTPADGATLTLNFAFPSQLRDVTFSADGAYFAVVSDSGLWAYATDTGALVYSQAITTGQGLSFVAAIPAGWSSAGNFTFAFASDGAVNWVDAGSGTSGILAAAPGTTPAGVAFNTGLIPEDGLLMAVAGTGPGGQVVFYSNTSLQPVSTLPIDLARRMAFGPDGAVLATIDSDGEAGFWTVGAP